MSNPEDWATTVVESNGADLLRYISRRSATERAELLNETLSIIWERRSAVPANPVEARMWSFGVARNVLRQHRRRLTQQKRLLEAIRLEIDGTDTASADPEHSVELSERVRRVHQALRALRPADRELVVLVHWDGFTVSDAATLLKLNPSTARTRYSRAKQLLASQLAEYGALKPPNAPKARADVET
ncbi:RNA polymerase sigma factor [Microbacterium oleivorans]|uniref:RNA polymerase sigma factor n=1 Tax=Microbacterium oleivorans TaxID=273677 RepID=UPI000A82A4E4|nr:sigma-70 family RNA polymerase sigma factor [Microbacterium oleivorans]